jgi:antitoxin component YwqK of YwqJK toxin-antitoxin module
MKRILAPILLLTLLFPALAFGVTLDDLVVRDGLHYKKFSDVPFTGRITGKEQGSFRSGKEDGPWIGYHDNGQLQSKGTFKNGKEDGPWVVYWDNGQLKFKATYKDGKKDGPWVIYHDNGQLFSKGTYKDGERDGPWVAYYNDGTVYEEYTGTYKNGVQVD